MFSNLYFLKRNVLFFFLVFSLFYSLNAQNLNNKSEHEFTIYVMPTMYPLDWSGPSDLYRSMKSCYLKTIALPDNYLLGHVAVGLNSTLLEKELLIAQSSGSLQEKLDLIMKQKVGFGILGAPMQGRLETTAELAHKLGVYARRNKLAFIRFKINELAARRMLTFIKQYSSKINKTYSASDFYGGAFWPLYHNEGAGCSAFGMALLDVAGILPPESKDWYVDVKIPMKIVGGEYNNGKKIRVKTIKRTDKWFRNDGVANVDYVRHLLYEPSIMFDWILERREMTDSIYKPFDDGTVPGLIVDMTHVVPDTTKPIFTERITPNIFVEKYMEKINAAE
jgi:hypothetical protein